MTSTAPPAPTSDLPEFFGAGSSDAPARARRLLHELHSDIVAAAMRTGTTDMSHGRGQHLDPSLFLSRPTILRRLARFLAHRIEAGTDRLIAGESAAVPLATALSLETGVPFAVLDQRAVPGDDAVLGELHPSERVMIIMAVTDSGETAAAAAKLAASRGARVQGLLVAFDLGIGAAKTTRAAGFAFEALLSSALPGAEEWVS